MTLVLPAGRRSDSWLGQRDARWRVMAFMMLVIAATLLRTPAGLAPLVLMASLGMRLAGVGLIAAIMRLGLLMLGVLPLIVVGQLLGAETMPTGLVLRIMAIGFAGLALVRAAPLAETFTAARSLGIPRLLCEVGRAADRQAVILAAEVRRMRVALRTRGFIVSTSRHSYRTLGQSLGGLLVRADDRAARVSAAMRTRGYVGRSHATQLPRTDVGDLVLMAGMLGALLSAVWLEWAGS